MNSGQCVWVAPGSTSIQKGVPLAAGDDLPLQTHMHSKKETGCACVPATRTSTYGEIYRPDTKEESCES